MLKLFEDRDGGFRFGRRTAGQVCQDRSRADQVLDRRAQRAIVPLLSGGDHGDTRPASLSLRRDRTAVTQASGEGGDRAGRRQAEGAAVRRGQY